LCGFTYEILDTSFGPYLSRIDSDEAEGFTGWLYFDNNNSPSVGAADYTLEPSDSVLWYYGDFGWKPTRLTLANSAIPSGASVVATTEFYENSAWTPLPSATVLFGTQSAVTSDSGQVSVSLPDGFYKIFAEEDGFVRSNQVLLKVGEPTSASVSLDVIVDSGGVGGVQNPGQTIAFSVLPDAIEFGVLAPGSEASQDVTITNTGSVGILVGTVLEGDDLFRDQLQVDNSLWTKFESALTANEARDHELKLTIPKGYQDAGEKQGTLTFWAITND